MEQSRRQSGLRAVTPSGVLRVSIGPEGSMHVTAADGEGHVVDWLARGIDIHG